jgi:hypothetical protein
MEVNDQYNALSTLQPATDPLLYEIFTEYEKDWVTVAVWTRQGTENPLSLTEKKPFMSTNNLSICNVILYDPGDGISRGLRGTSLIGHV